MDRLLVDPYEHLSELLRLYLSPLKSEELSRHLALDFEKLASCISDDVYEWNHAIFCFLAWLRSKDSNKNSSKDRSKVDNLSCADLLLKLDCLRDFPCAVLVSEFEECLPAIYDFVFKTHDLSRLDRYDLITRVDSTRFRANNDLIMTFACYCSFFLKRQFTSDFLEKYSASVEFELKADSLAAWCASQSTYFTINRFRVRIQNILWYLLDDVVNRNLYTYVSTGEICSKYSNLLRCKSSSWMTKLTQDITYLSAEQLFGYSNSLVAEATVLAVIEAHFQSQYTVDILHKYFCFEDSILEHSEHILCNSNPMILRCGLNWFVSYEKNIYKLDNLFSALVLWFSKLQGKLLDTVDVSGTVSSVLGLKSQAACSDFVEVF